MDNKVNNLVLQMIKNLDMGHAVKIGRIDLRKDLYGDDINELIKPCYGMLPNGFVKKLCFLKDGEQTTPFIDHLIQCYNYKPIDHNNIVENKFVDDKVVENKFVENKFVENKFVDDKVVENKFVENKFVDDKVVENKEYIKSLIGKPRIDRLEIMNLLKSNREDILKSYNNNGDKKLYECRKIEGNMNEDKESITEDKGSITQEIVKPVNNKNVDINKIIELLKYNLNNGSEIKLANIHKRNFNDPDIQELIKPCYALNENGNIMKCCFIKDGKGIPLIDHLKKYYNYNNENITYTNLKQKNEVNTNQVNTNQVNTNLKQTNQVNTNLKQTNDVNTNEVNTNEVNTNQVNINEVNTNLKQTNEVNTNEVNTNEVNTNQVNTNLKQTNDVNTNLKQTNEVNTNQVNTNEVNINDKIDKQKNKLTTRKIIITKYTNNNNNYIFSQNKKSNMGYEKSITKDERSITKDIIKYIKYYKKMNIKKYDYNKVYKIYIDHSCDNKQFIDKG